MNISLVSKTVPNKEYFISKLEEIGHTTASAKHETKSLDAEQLMIYIARVSSSRDNKLEDYEGLLNYLIDEGHWSPFQMADMTVEIETSRAIGRQLIRHRSFKFQEFSQRYSSDIEFEDFEFRGKASGNRQSSKELLSTHSMINTTSRVGHNYGNINGRQCESVEDAGIALQDIKKAYSKLLDAGVASETARMILPECTSTTLYMKGSVRSWATYLDLRTKENTQKEHREIANEIGKIFQEEFPVISNALDFNYE